MKRQEYSPKESLERVKLMMNYDTRKTLTENKESISEDSVTASAVGTGVGAAVGAATAAIVPAQVGATGYLVGGTTLTQGLSTALGVSFLTSAGIIGGAVGLAVVPLVYWLITKDTGMNKVKKMFEMCSSESAKIAKLERKMQDSKLRSIADDIEDAIINDSFGFQGGTDEEKLFGAFNKLESGTASDFCALITIYNRNSDSGDLFDDLDSDIDAESEWKQIFRPIRNCVEDSLLKLEDESGGGGDNGKKPVPVPSKGWRVCADPYSRGCKEKDPNGPLHKVQSCLGVKSDGLFGGKTEGALLTKTQSKTFTAKDVDKICTSSGGGGTQQPTQDPEYTIDTENQEAGETDTEGV